MDLFIGDPKYSSADGKHHTLKFKIPRNTRKLFIKSDSPIAPSDASTTFTLICEIENSRNVIKNGDWTFVNASNNRTDVLKIPFEEGRRCPFYEKDNLRESRLA